MSEARSLVASLFKLDDIGKNFAIFSTILPAPVKNTLAFVERDGGRDAALSFLGFGLAAVVFVGLVLGFEQPGLEQFGWQGRLLQVVIQPLGLLVYFGIYYKIFSDVSRSGRSFDQYVTLCGIQGGFTYLTFGLLMLVGAISPQLFIVFGIGYVAFLIGYSLMTFKGFWGISYGKVILYSFICALLSAICMTVLFAVLSAILLAG